MTNSFREVIDLTDELDDVVAALAQDDDEGEVMIGGEKKVVLDAGEAEEGEGEVEEEEASAEIWVPYTCTSLTYGRQHPGHIVEAANIASIPLPRNNYPLEETLGNR